MEAVRSLLLQEKLQSPAADKIIAALGRWANTPPALILKELEEFQSQYLSTCQSARGHANVSLTTRIGVGGDNMDRLIDAEEMAAILKVDVSWLYQRTRLGQEGIPHVKLGKYVRFDPLTVMEFFKNKQV
jgi:hypothetical protein